jgi:hypothetical protein
MSKKSRLAIAASVGIVASLAGFTGTAAADGPAITRTPWEMYVPPAPYGSLGFGLAYHGAPSAYQFASIPAIGDAGWQPAPDPDVIGFDGRVAGYGGGEASRLYGYPCLEAVDYTYFQTVVGVPTGGTVDTFTVDFAGIDDGARITIFNSAYPAGIVVPGSYVYLGGSGTADLADYVTTGQNRVVVTQVDDCAVGNILSEASIVLNGTVVPQVSYVWDRFLQPINDTAHQVAADRSVFKAGSTVPVKFQLELADGTPVQSAVPPVFLTPEKGAAMSADVDESLYSATGTPGNEFRYDPVGAQYVYNWKTSSKDAGYWWRIGALLPDGSKHYVTIGLR